MPSWSEKKEMMASRVKRTIIFARNQHVNRLSRNFLGRTWLRTKSTVEYPLWRETIQCCSHSTSSESFDAEAKQSAAAPSIFQLLFMSSSAFGWKQGVLTWSHRIQVAAIVPSPSTLVRLPSQAMTFEREAAKASASPSKSVSFAGPFPFVDESTRETPCAEAVPYEYDLVTKLVNDEYNELEIRPIYEEPKVPVKQDVDPNTRELQRRLVLTNKVEKVIAKRNQKNRAVTPSPAQSTAEEAKINDGSTKGGGDGEKSTDIDSKPDSAQNCTDGDSNDTESAREEPCGKRKGKGGKKKRRKSKEEAEAAANGGVAKKKKAKTSTERSRALRKNKREAEEAAASGTAKKKAKSSTERSRALRMNKREAEETTASGTAKKKPKTNAERCREHRENKREAEEAAASGLLKEKPKTSTERSRERREKKRASGAEKKPIADTERSRAYRQRKREAEEAKKQRDAVCVLEAEDGESIEVTHVPTMLEQNNRLAAGRVGGTRRPIYDPDAQPKQAIFTPRPRLSLPRVYGEGMEWRDAYYDFRELSRCKSK